MIMRLLIIFFTIPQISFADFVPRWDEFTTIPGESKQELIEKFRNKGWDSFIENAVSEENQKLNDGSAELLLATGLLNQDFPVLSYAVLANLIETYPTSHIVDLSLEAITSVFQSGKIETGLLQEIFDKRIIKPQSDEAKAILQYHRGLTLRHQSFFKWAHQELKSLPENTFWKQYLDFMKTTKASKNVEPKKLLSLWTDFLERPKLEGNLKQRATLNKARALYELGQFELAETTYKSLSLSRFDQGTVLRELGWLYYLTSRYKEALGVLNQLKSSAYSMYYHVDEYLLAGLIYRETCQPELLKGLSQSLEKRLEKIKKDIQKIRPYDNNAQVFQFAIHHPILKDRARMMTYLNKEIERAKEQYSGEALKLIEKSHKRLEDYTMRVINRHLVETNREAIEELLALKDQIDYLSYSLRLRRIKVTETSYKEKVANARKTARNDQIVWPVYKEIWEDEVINFQSVLENRCL